MWEISSSHIPSWSECQRWHQVRSVSTGLTVMGCLRKCDGLGVLAKFGESVYYCPAVEQKQVERNQHCMLVCILGTTRTSSILIMTTDGVVKAAGFRRMSEVSRWNVEM